VFTIQDFTYPSGSPGWRVIGTKHDGTRVREKFVDRSKAGGRQQELQVESVGANLATALRPTRLTDAQLQKAELAFAKLEGTPHDVLFAVEYLLQNYRAAVNVQTVKKAFDEFILAKKSKRPDTLRNLTHRIGFLVTTHGTKYVHEVTRDDLELIINADGLEARTQINRRLALTNFFRWCVKKKYCATNPVTDIERPTADEKRPEVFRLPEIRRILDAAQTFKNGKLLPYTVLCLFCGLRPTEAARITWDDIDLGQKIIRVEGEHSKVRSVRTIELNKNAVAWLRPPKNGARPIVTKKNFRKDLDAMRKRAGFLPPQKLEDGFKPWIQDGLRHTGISAHLSSFENEGKTAIWAGMSPNVVHKFYKGSMTKSQAKQFWRIRPVKKQTKIVHLAQEDHIA
jgi:site-specific recombinase XerD